MSGKGEWLPERRNFAKGTVIFREGDAGDEAYLVQQGVVRIFKTVSGRRVTIGRIWPSQVFGDFSMLDNAPRMAAALADDDVVCLVVRKQAIRDMLDQAPPGLTPLIHSLLATTRAMGQDLAEARAMLADHGIETT